MKKQTGKRIQVYLAARHRAWWENLPRYERSRVVAEALDLWREREQNNTQSVVSSRTKPRTDDA
jgi:acyl-CoA reductase-like NAD-dependent aldehyde dehydrogenase